MFVWVIWSDYEFQLPVSSSKGTWKETLHDIFTAGVIQKTQLRKGLVLNLVPVSTVRQKVCYEKLRWTIHKKVLSKDPFDKNMGQITGQTIASTKGTHI